MSHEGQPRGPWMIYVCPECGRQRGYFESPTCQHWDPERYIEMLPFEVVPVQQQPDEDLREWLMRTVGVASSLNAAKRMVERLLAEQQPERGAEDTEAIRALITAATEANEAMRLYNRERLSWAEYDAAFGRLSAALARLDTKGERDG